jgi:hypothetical protein
MRCFLPVPPWNFAASIRAMWWFRAWKTLFCAPSRVAGSHRRIAPPMGITMTEMMYPAGKEDATRLGCVRLGFLCVDLVKCRLSFLGRGPEAKDAQLSAFVEDFEKVKGIVTKFAIDLSILLQPTAINFDDFVSRGGPQDP